MAEPHTPARTGLIFAGGRATRLGGVNKVMLDVRGKTILARILEALEPLVDELVAMLNAPDTLGALVDVRMVLDPRPHAGVLSALATGLEAARGELCLAVAGDMPFVSTALFRELLIEQREADADVVIPRSEGFLEPMHAVYRREPVLRAVRAALGRGEQRMISYLGDVRVRELDEPRWRQVEAIATPFFNVNTPEDLAEARRIAEAMR